MENKKIQTLSYYEDVIVTMKGKLEDAEQKILAL